MTHSEHIQNKLRSSPQYRAIQKMAQELHLLLTSEITAVRQACEEKKEDYEILIRKFEMRRGTPFFYPYVGSGLGNGPYVLLEDGSVKLDFISGIGPNYWGHSPKELLPSAIEALFLNDTIMQGNLQPNRSCYDLMDLLSSLSGFDHCFITTSGTMAGENALKILFQKQFPKQRLLAFDRAFTGRSCVMSQITDNPSYRQGLPQTVQTDYIPFYEEELGVERSVEKTIACLNRHMTRYPESHVALCAELIQGEGGFRVGHPTYFQKLFSMLRERSVPIWLDEVQTFGRTTELFAAQAFGVMEFIDVLTIGKVAQVCATLFRSEMKPGLRLISQTFTASSSAFSAALWGIRKALDENHYGEDGKVAHLHAYFSHQLEALKKRTKNRISGPWGMGSMICFTPFEGDEKKTVQFAKELFQNGLIGFTCGIQPTRIRFLLPVGAMEEKHIDEAISIMEQTLVGE